MRRCYYLASSLRHPVVPFRQGNHHHHTPPSIVLEAVNCHASVAVHRDYSVQAFSPSRPLLQGVVPRPPPCLLTSGQLYDLLAAYNALVPDTGEPTEKATRVFQQSFVAGTERKPQCNVCGLYIGQHPATSVPEKQVPLFIDGGAWPTQLSPPRKTKSSFDVSFVITEAGKWCFEPDVAERMIRNREYTLMWERLQGIRKSPGRKGLLIMGHPGIGKTLLLDLLLSWNLCTYPTQPVIVIAVGVVTVFTNVDGETPKRHVTGMPLRDTLHFTRQLIDQLGVPRGVDILVLHDIKTEKSVSYQAGLLENLIANFNITCVLASSPKESNYKDFVKDISVDKFVLPTLSFAEIKEVIQHLNPKILDEMALDWYKKVGGVLRHMKNESTVNDAVTAQKESVRGLLFDPGHLATHNTVATDTNKLVQPLPSPDRRSVDVYDFVSEHARRAWFEHQDSTGALKQLNRLESATGSTRDVIGRFFEDYVISLLKSDFGFSRRKLDDGKLDEGKLVRGMLEPWVVRTAKKFTVAFYPGNDATSVKKTGVDTLYIPQSSQFPVVDAVIVSAKGDATLSR